MKFITLIAIAALASAEPFDDDVNILSYVVRVFIGLGSGFTHSVIGVCIGVTIVRRLLWMRKTLAVLTSHGVSLNDLISSVAVAKIIWNFRGGKRTGTRSTTLDPARGAQQLVEGRAEKRRNRIETEQRTNALQVTPEKSPSR